MSESINNIANNATYLSLGEDYFSIVLPAPFETEARLVHFNEDAAKTIGLDKNAHKDPVFHRIISGQQTIENCIPFAMLYSGHQFGHYVKELGDGRAITLAEITNPHGKKCHDKWELQLKGSGLTPYSREGDGRAILRSTIREYLCSEAMHGLGIPTTRALAIVTSYDKIIREQIEPGAILARVAPSHIRFGSFEVFFYRNQHEHVRILADHVLKHYYPELLSTTDPYRALLREVIKRTAKMIAQWQSVGFSHGVMNTDNMSILGLTIDYGPYGFMEAYNPGFICNSSDHHGRYAFDQQPDIGLFNISCLAQALLPLLDENPDNAQMIAIREMKQYKHGYMRYYHDIMQKKLGLTSESDEDKSLLVDLLVMMKDERVDYTILFRQLCDFDSTDLSNNTKIRDLFLQRERFDKWAVRYQQRLSKEDLADIERQAHMKQHNPKYILRNYLAENAIYQAQTNHDYSEVDKLFKILQKPFDEQPEYESYADFPPDWAQDISVSCSS
ncbi:MAG: YdiU family protein [Gammaproteobacteria bacterium]